MNAAVREALQEGRLAEALGDARELLAADPADAEARYLEALALSRLGSAVLAEQVVSRLLTQPGVPEAVRADAFALQGRLRKDLVAGAHAGERAALALHAAMPYEEAFRIRPDAFFAVNAASLYRLAGDAERSETLARAAIGLAAQPDSDYWHAATHGEGSLLIGLPDDARRHYRMARSLAGRRFGDVASMRRQLALLATVLPEADECLEELPSPTVVVFSGHMIDARGRQSPRFPASLEGDVRQAIDRWLDGAGVVIGHSQAACGSDILFLEALQQRGCDTHVTLPCAKDDYLVQSVAFAGGDWPARFERVLAAATRVGYATAEAHLGDDVLFEHASRFIAGAAMLRARQLAARARMLAVVDTGAEGAGGGTRHTLDEWRQAGGESEIIDLAALRGPAAPGAAPGGVRAATAKALGRRICGIVFCDVRGYSKLREQYSPLFQRRFLGEAREVIDALRGEFMTAQSAGDGLYATFATARAAAEFSLQLRDRVGGIDWTQFGMAPDTHVRVALHCGPAFPIHDPVMDQPNYCGTHVSRTARIEPIVTPGEVFATESMAAYLALQAPRAYGCDYLGVLPLAKGFGSMPLYRLRRA
jgi:tetratricopeptide (TPR) repeat protein